MRTCLAVLFALTLFAPASAEACSCIAPDLKRQWHSGDEILAVRIVRERVVGMERRYAARVLQNFSGCLQPRSLVILTTPFDSATCGTTFVVGERYVVGTRDNGVVINGRPARSINSCDWQTRIADLTADESDFLWSRPLSCRGQAECADGSQPVSCLVDPCSNAPACLGGTCEDNYCGDCRAEFYDANDYPVCEPW